MHGISGMDGAVWEIGDRPAPKPTFFIRNVRSYYDLGGGLEKGRVARFIAALRYAYNCANTPYSALKWWLTP